MKISSNYHLNKLIITMSDDETDKELELDWIDKFEKEDIIYNKYELCEIETIEFVYIYTFKGSIIEINKEKVKLTIKNKIKKEEQLFRVMKNLRNNYKLMLILLYNINVKNIKEINNNNFFNKFMIIDDINLYNTLGCFKDLNSIYFIFNRNKNVNTHNMTKKIYYSPNAKSYTNENNIKKTNDE